MDPLLVVIVTFGLIFAVMASLRQRFAMATESFRETPGAQKQLSPPYVLSPVPAAHPHDGCSNCVAGSSAMSQRERTTGVGGVA